jgi:hypothetical protein
MKGQTTHQTRGKSSTAPVRGLAGHTAVRAVREQERVLQAAPETHFGHDFSQAEVRPVEPMVGQRYATQACPVFPRTCPFGGACHTCPVSANGVPGQSQTPSLV